MPNKKKPKGILIAIGGREDKGEDILGLNTGENQKFLVSGILKEITSLLDDKGARIEVFTTASGIPGEMQNTYRASFQKLGFYNLGFNHMDSKTDANQSDVIERIQSADAIFFTGGSQLRLLNLNEETEFLRQIKKLFEAKRIVIAGTSAGAMVMSSLMIDFIDRNGSSVVPGFSFVEGVIIDTHFASRGRFGRLAQAVALHPECIGIGVDENTAIIVRSGNLLEVIGFGTVIIIEGHQIKYFTSQIEKNDGFMIENLITHALTRGYGYDINNRTLTSVIEQRRQKKRGSKKPY